MRRALTLARRGSGKTAPNPMVGAVIADDSGAIIAEGYHKRAGAEHAETAALKKAGKNARGKTLYVTLEPCNHQGRTPPCTDAILQSGIRRVVVAMPDPNPRVAGGGIQRLTDAGLEVAVGDGAQEAERLNQAFITWSRERRPYVVLKAAMTLDGKIASRTGESKYLTSEKALAHAHALRRNCDAILVGSGTVLADDPWLTFRGRGRHRDPIRVILDSRGRIAPTAHVLNDTSNAPTLLFTSESASVDWERDMFSARGEVVRVGTGVNGHVNLREVLEHLADRHILSVLVEGGPSIHAAFIEAQLADVWISYIAPLILGGTGAPSPVAGHGFALADARHLSIRRVLRRDPDLIIEADFLPKSPQMVPLLAQKEIIPAELMPSAIEGDVS